MKSLAPADRYRLLVNTVTPRPIAWVVSRNADGLLNAAPYSFFNVLGSEPPLCVLGIGQRAEGDPKDTARNIVESGEFTVNLVGEHDTRIMVDTAAEAPRDVSEIDVLGITTRPASLVSTPLIASAPAALECRLWKPIDTGGNFTIILGEILALHIGGEFLSGPDDRPRVDTEAMGLVGRAFGAGGYIRNKDTFEEARVGWPLPGRDG
ncbi:flavin reductase family protein [Croceicoccus marinus]|nr:flavin reductase family protein [Croceicoccus marinus]